MKKTLLAACTMIAFIFGCSQEEIIPEKISEAGYKIIEKNDKLYVYPVENMQSLSVQEIAFTQEVTEAIEEASIYPNGVHFKDGEIDIQTSVTGKKYQVAYSGASTRMKVEEELILSGISYGDGIFKLADGQTQVQAIYNEDATLSVPQGSFELKDTTGQLVQQPTNGTIDLLGIAQQGPGKYTVDYQLYDESNGASNSTKVNVYVYDYLSDVPSDLLNRVNGLNKLDNATGNDDDEIIIIVYP